MSTIGQEHSYLTVSAVQPADDHRVSYWRQHARRVINQVIEEHGREHPQIRKLIREAYPFGLRSHWPYKCWLREVREALEVDTATPQEVELPGQTQLFEEPEA